MENTYLDYFNYYLKEFCNEVINHFPQYKNVVLANYRPLLEGRDNKSEVYVKYFLNNINKSIDDVCAKRVEMFDTDEPLNFLVGVNFSELWKSDMNTESTQRSMWKYLQLLALLSRNVIPELEEITELLSKVGGEIEAPSKMLRTFADEDDLAESDNGTSAFDMFNAVSMVTNLFQNGGTTFDNIKGLLSGVLKGLGMEDIEETLEKFNISDIISNLGLDGKELNMETLQDVLSNPEQMKDVLNKLTENLDTCSAGEENGFLGQMLMMMKQMMAMFNPAASNTASDADNSTNNDGTSNTDGTNNTGDNTAPLGDMFSNMMNNMMNNEAISKMAEDLQSGNGDGFNPMAMLSQMMGNGNIQNMAKQMAKSNPGLVQQAQRQRSSERQTAMGKRLKAKLEAKRAAEAKK